MYDSSGIGPDCFFIRFSHFNPEKTMRTFYLLCLFLFLAPLFSAAQGGTLADKKRQAKEFFINAHYQDALRVLQTAQNNQQSDRESIFLKALCLYQLNKLNDAELLFKGLIEEKSAYPESWLYLARIYHDRHEFLTASDYYKAYLKTLAFNDPNRSGIRDAIRRCSNGIQWQFRQPLAIVENLGPQINTSYDEFGPILSPASTERLYFSSARPGSTGGLRNRSGQPDEVYGRFTSDIFYAQLQNGQWKNATGLSYTINSPRHEVALDFGLGGRSLHYFKGNNFSQGQIYVDSTKAGASGGMATDIFYGPVDALAGISAPHFMNDKTIIFPSQRPGGYGGLDLYKTEFSNGQWSVPQNLGPTINSAYDETTPFMARDGKSLYFSTNNTELSMGGFDVVKAVFNTYAGNWTRPVNLGMPVNSAGDETHFRLSRDGYSAYFASSRKDGMGERDLFAAYFFDYLPEMGAAEPAGKRPVYVQLVPHPREEPKTTRFLDRISPNGH